MKIKQAFILILLAILPLLLFAQNAPPTNQYNKGGEKEGLWIENYIHGNQYYYYKDGIKDGIYRDYSKKNILMTFGEFKKGECVGTWYYFDENGFLLSMDKDFKINHTIITKDNIHYKHSSYYIGFYPNGNKQREGVILWEGDPRTEFYEYGTWKYYDETGKLTKTKTFK